MGVEDALTSTRSGVEYGSVAIYIVRKSNLLNESEDIDDALWIGCRNLSSILEVFLRDDQEVGGCYGIDVVDGKGTVILGNTINWDRTISK